jgi:hypothetical protein
MQVQTRTQWPSIGAKKGLKERGPTNVLTVNVDTCEKTGLTSEPGEKQGLWAGRGDERKKQLWQGFREDEWLAMAACTDQRPAGEPSPLLPHTINSTR